jgi:hypothetical protein
MRDLDLYAGVTGTAVVTPAVVNATGAIGSSVDLQGYEGVAILDLQSINTAGSSPTLALKIQDSADNSTFADVSPALAFTGLTTTTVNGQQELKLDLATVRRYIQVYATIGGTSSPSYTLGVRLLARKKYL